MRRGEEGRRWEGGEVTGERRDGRVQVVHYAQHPHIPHPNVPRPCVPHTLTSAVEGKASYILLATQWFVRIMHSATVLWASTDCG